MLDIDLPDFLRPRLRVFLSVDIVNSTSFKQNLRNLDKNLDEENDSSLAEPWFSPISLFYREIERHFYHQWNKISLKAKETLKCDPGSPPSLWKTAGDEVFYVKTISHHKQLLVLIWSWIEAVNLHRKELKRQHPTLDLKSAAWLAGFPVNNAEVVLRNNIDKNSSYADDPVLSNLELLSEYNEASRETYKDYIGPSIDTGFRIAALASPRKFTISLDLALMLAHADVNLRSSDPPDFQNIIFHYDGRLALKGVLNGAPYPIFWIDMAPDDPLNQIEDGLTNTTRIGSSDVKKFCELFIQKTLTSHMMIPFICDTAEDHFSDVPQYHKSRLEKLKDYWENEKAKRDDELSSAEATDDASGILPNVDDCVDRLVSAANINSD